MTYSKVKTDHSTSFVGVPSLIYQSIYKVMLVDLYMEAFL